MTAFSRRRGFERRRRDMRVAVLGTGSMGTPLATHLTAYHDVAVGSRDPERGRQRAMELGAVHGGSYEEAAADSEVVILAVPWISVGEVIPVSGDLSGKVVVDITNPYVDGELRVRSDSSDAEEIQLMIPDAAVVKAFNTIFAEVLQGGADFGDDSPTVLIAGDSGEAKAAVGELASGMGYDSLDVGPLTRARALEHLLAGFTAISADSGGDTWAMKILRRDRSERL
jgi:NADPH-dependent F420 reductase